jgi:hypothetical protein
MKRFIGVAAGVASPLLLSAPSSRRATARAESASRPASPPPASTAARIPPATGPSSDLTSPEAAAKAPTEAFRRLCASRQGSDHAACRRSRHAPPSHRLRARCHSGRCSVGPAFGRREASQASQASQAPQAPPSQRPRRSLPRPLRARRPRRPNPRLRLPSQPQRRLSQRLQQWNRQPPQPRLRRLQPLPQRQHFHLTRTSTSRVQGS